VTRWLIVLSAIAVAAMIAGFLVFGGANMGH
jgi:hypothetical protein